MFGLGRVGLPLAVAWLRAGQRVIGADIDPNIVQTINEGVSHLTDEPRIGGEVEKYVRNGKFWATDELEEASKKSDVKLITVPTTKEGSEHFYGRPLEKVLRVVGKHIERHEGVSIECSVQPGTTDSWAKHILEHESSYRAETDFGLVFSPERIYEGRALEDIETRYPKIIGGVGPRSTELFLALYRRVSGKGVIAMSSSTAAEMSKLFEGVYRDVNIALANELGKLCKVLGEDFYEIRAASNSQSFCHLHLPGVGVGGACIPFYPEFVLEEARRQGLSLLVTKNSRELNRKMPEYTVSQAEECLKGIGKRLCDVKIVVLGAAFRGGVSDTRSSPAHRIVDILMRQSVNIVVHDPMVLQDEFLEKRGVRLVNSLEEACSFASLVIIATDHVEYADLNLEEIARLMDRPAVIFDGRGVLRKMKAPEGLVLAGIGYRKENRITPRV